VGGEGAGGGGSAKVEVGDAAVRSRVMPRPGPASPSASNAPRDQPADATRPAGPVVARGVVEALLEIYRRGAFPMADPQTGEINLFSPDPRAILPIEADPGEPGGLRVSRSLRAALRRGRLVITSDRAFARVIRACAEPRPNQEDGSAWIDERIIALYLALHEAGHAHSIEAWLPTDTPDACAGEPGTLVGGLYGVHINGAFFGESMFSRPSLGGTDASKVCLVHLARHLRAMGVSLLDTQFTNPHIDQFGPINLPREEYLRRLADATARPVRWQPVR
jgi:leucyl/phenylalanyl-tRNA--protein transferase